MERYQRVKEHDGFIKDTFNGAIVNTNASDLKAYKARKNAALAMRDELDQVKNDVSEIKQMLIDLLHSTNKR